MEPWKIYLAGWFITFITWKLIRTDSWNDFFYALDITAKLHWKEKIIVLLISISVFIVGGMTVGGVQTEFKAMESGIWDIIPVTILGTICTYGVGSWVLRFGDINKKTRIFFKVIFLISIFFWGAYLSRYYSNIEMIEEKELESKKVEEVVYFSVKDSNINCLYRENGEEKYKCISVDNAKIDVDDNIEKPYVEIYSYTITKREINNNNGEEKIKDKWKIEEYSFHLNGEVMK